MKGFPKVIATAADLKHLLGNDAYKAQGLVYLQTLMDERYGWVIQGQLDVGVNFPATAGHKIVDVKDDAGVVTQRYLYQWMIDPANTLARFGITPEEAVAWGCVDNVIAAPEE
jgi:hypothetical protein